MPLPGKLLQKEWSVHWRYGLYVSICELCSIFRTKNLIFVPLDSDNSCLSSYATLKVLIMIKQTNVSMIFSTYHLFADECAAGIDKCEHICNDTNEGYTCSCFTGYSLSADGHTCEGQIIFSCICVNVILSWNKNMLSAFAFSIFPYSFCFLHTTSHVFYNLCILNLF